MECSSAGTDVGSLLQSCCF